MAPTSARPTRSRCGGTPGLEWVAIAGIVVFGVLAIAVRIAEAGSTSR
jgi:hypothetical protein